ncbi:ATP synthase F0 subunit B [Candidatus Peregrinibacteria bacterium]|nr:ATP synthase F0 subunit B [Candidatus Peregrinibacteria bacterium]
MELLAKLGVDLNLIIAQVVNFAILLGILSYFVYRPLLNLLDTRRARIQKAMDDAARIEQQTSEMEQIRHRELKKIDSECGVYMERIRKQAESVEQEILLRAKGEAQAMIDAARKQLNADREQLFQEAFQRTASLVMHMTEKLLQREFGAVDEKRILAAIERDIPTLVR